MIDIIKKIDIDPLLTEYQKLEDKIQWSYFPSSSAPQMKQTGLQYKKGDDDIWSGGVGISQGNELYYDLINPFFKNTVFESLIIEFNLKRSRLMWLGPRSCYSMHRDKTGRLHIPLISNKQCFMIFKKGLIQYLHPGYVYNVDTKNIHTAMNGSDEWRLHFIGCLEE